jgi:hypothetical protein
MLTVAEQGAGDKDNREKNNILEGWVDEVALLTDEQITWQHCSAIPHFLVFCAAFAIALAKKPLELL